MGWTIQFFYWQGMPEIAITSGTFFLHHQDKRRILRDAPFEMCCDYRF